MKLVQSDWHYKSVLAAKQKAIVEGINLAKELEQYYITNKEEISDEIYNLAMDAIKQFKLELKKANEPNQGYLYLQDQSASFFKCVETEPVSSYLSVDVVESSCRYRRFLAKQDAAETLPFRRSHNCHIALLSLLAVALVAAFITALVLCSWNYVVLLPVLILPLARIMEVIQRSGEQYNWDINSKRAVVSEGIAVTNIEEKFKLFSPSAPVHCQAVAEDMSKLEASDSGQPVVAQVIGSFN